jgi:predicted amidophosphoribosyltransferase
VQDLKFPAAAGLSRLFSHALETGVSTPCMDCAFTEAPAAGVAATMRIVGAPVTVADAGPMLVATIDPASAPTAAEAHVLAPKPREATAEFLCKTLVHRRALRSRKDVSYVTLRSWRQPIREHQISALKALKRHAPDSLSGEIAGEIADDVRSLFGAGGFTAVVPVPCGHSPPGSCLSAAVAREVGIALGLPVAHALRLPAERGGSHPKANAKRAAMTLATPLQGPVLLVDDVATSGRHIEEATELLRAKGASVLAVAWIGGDAEKGD